MLRIDNGSGVELGIRFFHGEVQGAFLDLSAKPPKRRYCAATADVNGHEIARAEAICHPMDNYVRAVGRKKAFARLLAMLDMPREARRKAWERFFAYGRPKGITYEQLEAAYVMAEMAHRTDLAYTPQQDAAYARLIERMGGNPESGLFKTPCMTEG